MNAIWLKIGIRIYLMILCFKLSSVICVAYNSTDPRALQEKWNFRGLWGMVDRGQWKRPCYKTREGQIGSQLTQTPKKGRHSFSSTLEPKQVYRAGKKGMWSSQSGDLKVGDTGGGVGNPRRALQNPWQTIKLPICIFMMDLKTSSYSPE